MAEIQKKWDLIINPHRNWFDFDWKSLWQYRDLIKMFIKRDFAVTYKQTILGPIWFILQPLISTMIFTIVFGKIARLPTDGIPPFLFYLSGMTAWGYFSSCVTETSNIFTQNAHIFTKVYFPRITIPVSVVVSNLLRFGIQFFMFILVYLYLAQENPQIKPGPLLAFVPLVVIQMGILGLSIGMLVSSLVTKYRDLSLLLHFGIQLWMFSCPIIYPLSQIPESLRGVYLLNPMASIIELFKAAFFGSAFLDWKYALLGSFTTILLFIIGFLVFNRVEKNFADVV